jgi:hypothetical protein
MHFRDIYFIGILLLGTTLPLLAQEESLPEMRMSGEFNLAYSQSVMGGFGSDFYRVINPIARFAESEDVRHAPWPKVHVGLEGVFLMPLYQNSNIQLFSSLSYSLKYSHERYELSFPDAPGSAPVDAFNNRRGQDLVLLNALTNHFNFGVRIQHQKSRLYGNVGLGVLLYNPFHLEWQRRNYDADGNQIGSRVHSVRGNQTVRIDDMPTAQQAGVHQLALRGSSEVLFALAGRIGYGPIFVGVSYATNIRVHNLSVDIGFTLYPQAGGNK